MAVGLPCITTDVGDAAYLLDNPEWVVSAASPDKLADKLDAMLSLSAVEREALGQAAASRIREHFTMGVISRRYYDLYASLIDAK
jgi:glycosyltransferase involved in cell wall biosynthesis